MSVTPYLGPIRRQTGDRNIDELFARLEIVERVVNPHKLPKWGPYPPGPVAPRASDPSVYPGGLIVSQIADVMDDPPGIGISRNLSSREGYARRELEIPAASITAADFAAAPVVLKFVPSELGAICDGYTEYRVALGIRTSGTVAGPQVRMVALNNGTGAPPHGSSAGRWSGFSPPVTAQPWYGLFDFNFVNNLGAVVGQHHKFTTGQEEEIKIWVTSGSGSVWVDCLYLLPAGFTPDRQCEPALDSIPDFYQWDTGESLSGPTAGFVADAHQGFESVVMTETQQRGGLRDPDLTFTARGITDSQWFSRLFDHNAAPSYDNYHVRHAYIVARLNAADDGFAVADPAAAFVALHIDTAPAGVAPVVLRSWGFHYLGPIFDVLNGEAQLANWLALPDDGTMNSYYLADGSNIDDVRVSDMLTLLDRYTPKYYNPQCDEYFPSEIYPPNVGTTAE